MDEGVRVGVRELRDGLSRHLAEVRSGREITVTDHGRAVARLVPVDEHSLARLVELGTVRPATAPRVPLPTPVEGGPVSDLVAQQRR